MIKYIDELQGSDLKGKKVLLRLDLNVEVVDGEIADDFDIQKIINTVDFLRLHDAQTIIIAHIEDAKGEPTTLLPVWQYLKGYFPVEFCQTYFTLEATAKLLEMKDKNVLLFENVRINVGEKENSEEFSRKLAQMADIFVNDAFGVCHRSHASVVSVPKFLPHYGGLLLRQEIENLSKVFNPVHPFVFILGGAKFETKMPLIKKYIERADSVFVGGALTHDIFKARGYEVGTSLVSKTVFDMGGILENPKLIVSDDVTVTNSDNKVLFKDSNALEVDECIVDAGPKTVGQLKNLLSGAKTIVWNGPLGNYEAGFSDKTEILAEIVAEYTENGALSIIGGGDTVAAINKLGLNEKFSFVSTGGGAMLDFLLDETLPGIEALEF